MQPPKPDPDDNRPLTDEEMTRMLRIPEAEWLRRLDEHLPATDPDKAELRALMLEMRAIQVEFAKTTEAHDENILQTAADVADAELEHYRSLKKAYRKAQTISPFDPCLYELQKQLDQLRPQIPKDEQ